MHDSFDIIVIGGGHAGAEAAWAASHMLPNSRIALMTMDPLAIGRMSCNPAIGGLAKGQIVREIDALGGLMGRAIDATGIQFRMLNRSKGPAVQSPRAQADKYAYAREVQRLLETECPNLTIVAGIADRLLFTGDLGNRVITGVSLEDGQTFAAKAVVITTGTFLRGLMHTGEAKTEGGRVGEQSARGLSASLKELGLELGRLKTGTPPRIAAESINYDGLEAQWGDEPPMPFSDMTVAKQFPKLKQVACHITWTNARVHELIKSNLHRAPMYSGQIQSRGPRYCPSIEDKVVRFADKERHQIFLEPESLETNEIYCNGISTSLPQDVQDEIIRSIGGLENAKILRYGYAVEYDFVPTHQIGATLEAKTVSGLFCAGQINGTSGYEEAGGQGLMAGINAARKIDGKSPVVLRRDQAYIGVMIDDLITKTPTEPYRMFTSRAEYRLMLRSDNTDQRLTPIGYEIGLAMVDRYQKLTHKLSAMHQLTGVLKAAKLPVGANGSTAYEMLRRPDVEWSVLIGQYNQLAELRHEFSAEVWEQVAITAKYAGYIEREKKSAERLHELEDKMIPDNFDFAGIAALRKEARQCLTHFRPGTIGQASRLEGITPNDLTVLMLHLRK